MYGTGTSYNFMSRKDKLKLTEYSVPILFDQIRYGTYGMQVPRYLQNLQVFHIFNEFFGEMFQNEDGVEFKRTK